ncbi:UNVERIFIED_CONTAM: Glucan endo-1,3-beta-glucosidase 6 [Sesamum radiatum]|uniref:Glucan endo-1,3-beta-glucosidase 6 n=1 Tax=Sesamum radiatum TaxID=300843 RepID=A0AAW2VVL9_SESRA
MGVGNYPYFHSSVDSGVSLSLTEPLLSTDIDDPASLNSDKVSALSQPKAGTCPWIKIILSDNQIALCLTWMPGGYRLAQPKSVMPWQLFGGRTPILLLLAMLHPVGGIGANWGSQLSHPLPPDKVVRMLRENGIQKVKLFDADYDTLKALGGSGIEVMVGIPNDMLANFATNSKAAEKWVSQNVSHHLTSNVLIRYVAVGNEPFLETYNGSFLRTTFPALKNVQDALTKAGLRNQVKVTVPLNADVYTTASGLPSGGDFRADIHDFMIPIVKLLSDNAAPFTVNIYPFISLYTDSNFPVEYAFFDGNATPVNDGAVQPRLHDISGGKGTPMRPGPINAYLFSLIDEDQKSIQPGNFERHWGIFKYDGQPKYGLNLGTTSSGTLVPARNVSYLDSKWCIMKPNARLDDSQVAPSVSYACGLADCTALGYQTSCSNLDARGIFRMLSTATTRRTISLMKPASSTALGRSRERIRRREPAGLIL